MEKKKKIIPGKITVEPTVLETIARLTVLNVSGVSRIAEKDVDRLLGRTGKMVSVEVRDGRVYVDLHIIAEPGVSLLQLGRSIQYEVMQSIQKMIGMTVEVVNVYIEDVVFPDAESQVEPNWAEAA
jgi:uncharacterized alkaline shock family protein YloU